MLMCCHALPDAPSHSDCAELVLLLAVLMHAICARVHNQTIGDRPCRMNLCEMLPASASGLISPGTPPRLCMKPKLRPRYCAQYSKQTYNVTFSCIKSTLKRCGVYRSSVGCCRAIAGFLLVRWHVVAELTLTAVHSMPKQAVLPACQQVLQNDVRLDVPLLGHAACKLLMTAACVCFTGH